MTNTLNSQVAPQLTSHKLDDESLSTSLLISPDIEEEPLTNRDDWSDSTKEILDPLPQVWTRGLLYFIIAFFAIILPWTMLYKIDETGDARGRLEPKGGTIKQEADVSGALSIISIPVKEGDEVVAGQILMELDSKQIRNDLQRLEMQLKDQQNKLDQLDLLKNQAQNTISVQQQQKQAQELQKLTQVEQAQQNLISVRSNSNLQKVEKLAPIDQAQQAILDSQTAYNLAASRFADAQIEVERYRKLYQKGVVAEVKVKEMEGLAKENLRLRNQAMSDIEQSKLRLTEQKRRFSTIIHQSESDIQQAELRLQEQKRDYDRLTKDGELAVRKSQEQLDNTKTQITSLEGEITQTKAQIKSLNDQLEKYLVRARIDGKIFDLPIKQPGAVVQPKQLIAEIAPKGVPLVFRGQIPTSETESLRDGSGQKNAKISFDDYKAADYEVVTGKLTWVSPNSKTTQAGQVTVETFDLEVELTQQCIQPKNKCIAFQAGQTASAQIIIRQRRIIDLLLDPFKKLHNGELKL